MKQFMNRLKSKAGETLMESMLSILLFTFGSIIMLSMITAAIDINRTVEKADAKYLEDMRTVELLDGADSTSTVTFSISGSSLEDETVPVDVYGGVDGGLYAYYEGGVAP